MAAGVFWLAIALVLYVYAGYPLLVFALARLKPRPVRKRPIEPRVSLLIAAYNEADVIEAKIRNALQLDYPPDLLEIVIASDGSCDGTAETALWYADGRRIRVLDLRHHRGKLAVLNAAVPALHGEIVVFSDAASMLERDAIRRLVAPFADPSVGAVSGLYTVRQTSASGIGRQEDFYWRYETFLKRQEALADSILGAHGALYAIRKELYPFPAPGTINDDYVIPVKIVRMGYRVYYEPGAVAWEEARQMDGFGRRVRIMTGNVQQLREIGTLLRPLRWKPLLFFLSHKAGRLAVPLAMLAAFVSSATLLHRPLFAFLWGCQAAFYLMVLAGALRPFHSRLLRLPYYFCMVNAAVFWGFYHALAGRRRLAWK